MAATSYNLTTYYAKRIFGDAAAASADSALLQTGTDIISDIWILNRTNRNTDNINYGIKYKYDSTTTHDRIEFLGGNPSGVKAYIQLDTGDASFSGTLGVTGNTTLGGTLGVTGNTTLGGTLSITGNTTLGGTLGVTGNTTLSGIFTVSNNATIGSSSNTKFLVVYDKLYINSTVPSSETYNLNVNGTTNITDDTTIGGVLGVTSNTTIGGTLGVTSNTTIGGTLGVTSNTTISGTLEVTGNCTTTGQVYINNTTNVAVNDDSGALVIGNKAGENIGIDGNKIHARSNKAASSLTLNNQGGNIILGVDNNSYDVNIRSTKVSNSISTGALVVGGGVGISGALNIGGNTSLSGTLSVTGDISLGGILNVTGNTSLGGTLSVTETVTLGHALTLTGTTTNGAILSNGIIYFTSSSASVGGTKSMIRFLDNTLDGNGHGISIGGGGVAIFGSGESSTTVQNGLSISAGAEYTYITSDNAIYFYYDQNSGYSEKMYASLGSGQFWIRQNNTSTTTYLGATRTDTGLEVSVHINNASQNHGLWSNGYCSTANGGYTADGKWLIYRDNSGKIISPQLYVGSTDITGDYSLKAASFICNSWVRTKGSTGWWNEDYQGGWYMNDAKWIKNYNSKPIFLNIASNNTYGIGGHRLVAGYYGDSHVSVMYRGGDIMYGFGVNQNGYWYFGKRTSLSFESSSGDAYTYYGNNTIIAPYPNNTITLGDSSHVWKACYATNFYGNASTATRATAYAQVIVYNYTYSIAANTTLDVTGTNLGVSTPSGYTPVAMQFVKTNSSYVVVRTFVANNTGGNTVVSIRNVHTSAVSSKQLSVAILYMKIGT